MIAKMIEKFNIWQKRWIVGIEKPFKSANARSRLVIAGSGSLIVGRIISMGFSMLLVGMIARYFSRSEFGLFAVLTSIVTLTGGLDFGLGNGLRDKLAALHVTNKSDDKEDRQYFFSTVYSLSMLTLIIIIGLALFGMFIPWQKVFNINDYSIAQNSKLGLPIITIIIILNVPLLVSSAGFFAYQMVNWFGLLNLLPNLFALCLVLIAITLHLGFYICMIAYFLGYTLAALLMMLIFIRIRRWPPIWIRYYEIIRCIRSIAGISVKFWLQAIFAGVAFSLGTYIVSQVLGLEAAGDFSLIQRLFLVLISIHLAAITPMWSALTQAKANGDWRWAKSTVKRMVLFSVVGVGLASLLLVVLYRPLIFWWTGKYIDNLPLVLAMATLKVLYAYGSAYSMAFNGFGMLRFPLIAGALIAVATVPINVFLGHKMGSVGIMIGQSLLLIPGVIISPLLINSEINRNLTIKDSI